jgi:hypothetical protein
MQRSANCQRRCVNPSVWRFLCGSWWARWVCWERWSFSLSHVARSMCALAWEVTATASALASSGPRGELFAVLVVAVLPARANISFSSVLLHCCSSNSRECWLRRNGLKRRIHTNPSGGSLGSRVDEERSKLRDEKRTAGRELCRFECTLRPQIHHLRPRLSEGRLWQTHSRLVDC